MTLIKKRQKGDCAMKKIYNFFLDPVGNQNCKTHAKEIKEILKKIGVVTQINISKNGYKTLVIEVDEDRIKQVTEQNSRNAGRKKKEFSTTEKKEREKNDITEVTALDFLIEVEANGMDKTAEKYGVSKRTVYRYIKMAKDELDWHDKK